LIDDDDDNNNNDAKHHSKATKRRKALSKKEDGMTTFFDRRREKFKLFSCLFLIEKNSLRRIHMERRVVSRGIDFDQNPI
jgi:hypothetical protein